MALTWDNIQTDLIGKLMLIDILQHDAMGNQLTHEQVFGTVLSADKTDGISIELGGLQTGKTLILPGDISNFARPSPGFYKLKTTGEEVEDPDFYCRWDIKHRSMVGVPNR